MMNLPGSFPGISSFATAPTIRPIMRVHNTCMFFPLSFRSVVALLHPGSSGNPRVKQAFELHRYELTDGTVVLDGPFLGPIRKLFNF
jgi:hypothetical protein